jgi:phosphoglycerate dehydrogenase-like enzyme
MRKILVTDTLFIFPEHEKRMRDAGFEVVRMSGDMSEDELSDAIKGKVGYILGGVETVTDKVIESADTLKVIAFTGTDHTAFIPGHRLAKQKGIMITNTPGTTTFPVAEFTITLMLAMLRHIFELGGPGDQKFITTQSLADCTVGIVGMGRIGESVTRMLLSLGAKEVVYWNRTRKEALEKEFGVKYLPLDELLAQSDVVSNHLSSEAGAYFTSEALAKSKNGQLLINTGAHNSIDLDALYEGITKHNMRAAFDIHGGVSDERFAKLPLSSWYSTNENAAYNTMDCLQRSSDMAVASLLNVLEAGTDQYVAAD